MECTQAINNISLSAIVDPNLELWEGRSIWWGFSFVGHTEQWEALSPLHQKDNVKVNNLQM
jgi:hypothetical protein